MRLAVGDTLPLVLQLENGDENMYPQVSLYKTDGTLIGTYDLAHVALGSYSNTAQTMPDEAFVHAVYLVYQDAGHTQETPQHSRTAEIFEKSRVEGLIGHNQVVEVLTRNANNDPLTQRIRHYDTLVNAQLDDGATGLLDTYLTTATYTAENRLDTFEMVRVGS